MTIVFGTCKIDGGRCDGEAMICRLNPEPKPTFVDAAGQVRPLFNRQCSNFKNVEEPDDVESWTEKDYEEPGGADPSES